MFLKRITLSGFKSFADRVDFDFGRGVTCVVGPNGCGKSNILDSFKWVLGEQSAKSLRGRQMIDMIFAGSSTRRSSSVAQVDLVFGNDDRTLPLDLDDVTVSRKLYRSGESEYLLNGEIIRLKDVRELFMDTGVGVDCYSVIEQGRVDSLLQHSPVERRIIFEEAAGISKYKARKREAERKLERTGQNLLRVEDIVEELEKRLRSVKVQAGKARNYKQYEVRLNELRSTFVLAEYHRLTETCGELDQQASTLSDQVTGHKTDIDRHEAEESETKVKVDRLSEEIAANDNQLVQAKSQHAASEERIAAARNRVEEQNSLSESARQRLGVDEARLSQSGEELDRVQQSAIELKKKTEELHQRIASLNADDGGLARELTQAQAILEDEKAGIIDLLRKSAQLHNEVVRLNSERESLVGQKGRLSVRDAQITGELEGLLEQRGHAELRVEELSGLIAEQTEALEEKKREAARIDTVRQQLVEEHATLKEGRSALQSRQELLADLQRNLDGVGAGVRALLDEVDHDDGPSDDNPVVGLVADLVDADVEHARVIETALGDRDQYVVAASAASFVSLAERLDDLDGRVTAICLDRIPPVLNERDFSESPGFVARAIDLVNVDPAYDRLARFLFSKTVVVQDLQAALRLAAEDPAGHRFVALNGQVVEPDGRVTVGGGSTGTGLISRRSELRDIEAELVSFDRRIETLADRLNRTNAEAAYLDTMQQDLRTAVYEANTSKVEATAARQKVVEAIDRLTGERPLIAREMAVLEQQIEEVLRGAQDRSKSLEEQEKENERREALVQQHKTRIDEVVDRRRELGEQLTDLKVQVGQYAEKRAAAADNIGSLTQSIRELESAMASARNDLTQCQARTEDAERTIATSLEKLKSLAIQIADVEQRGVTFREERDANREALDARTRAIKEARDSLERVEAELHRCEVARTEAKVRRDELVGRVAEELGVDLVQRYREQESEDADWEQDWDAIEAEINELKGKMDRLGNVNLDAIDELAELEERHGFLTGQRDDLTQSQRQLEQLIRRLDEESKERFHTAFIQIRDNFRGLFRKLFGGGRADIILEDEDNELDCGIEIVAQPPGKELQAISLMSGGEKSMTAIALLMSIFKCKPAPFAILDEVDAALDEANNDRFNRIIQEFVHQSQFIIVTHSKRTMGIAEQLYGITMQEPGVSTRVSVQLSDAEVA